MSIQSILLPIFVQVALIFAIGLGVAFVNRSPSRAGGRGQQEAALGNDARPLRAKLLNDSFSNQFELPVLFFALAPLAILTRKADLLFVIMAWLFVLSRIGHAAVHTTSNRQPARGILWFAGVAILLLMWAIFALRTLFSPALGAL
jgi:hypothetical protein